MRTHEDRLVEQLLRSGESIVVSGTPSGAIRAECRGHYCFAGDLETSLRSLALLLEDCGFYPIESVRDWAEQRGVRIRDPRTTRS